MAFMTDSEDERARDEGGWALHPSASFPPPFLFVAGFLGGLALERRLYRWSLVRASTSRLEFSPIGWLGVALGVVLVLWALVTYGRARTAAIPNRRSRLLRDPMYVALSVLYVGLALVFNVGWPLVLWPVVIVALYMLVIRREERDLTGAFGAE